MALRGLIFDFDGLLVDTETAIVSAWEDIHAEDGFQADRAVLHAIIGHVGVDGDIWRAYPADHDRLALDLRMQTVARLRCEAAPLRPGVLALLETARAAGLKLAVASNSSHRHVDGHLAARGLLEKFHAVLCRDDVTHGKPRPDLYLAALEKLELRASEAVAFEDSVPGHQAAAAAGLRVVVIPNPATAHDAFPHAALHTPTMEHLTLSALEKLPLP
jgi:putative hydrolase of the HAD superfamily